MRLHMQLASLITFEEILHPLHEAGVSVLCHSMIQYVV